MSVIQKNIFDQLDASKKLFDIVQKLAKVADEEDRQKRRFLLEEIMQEILAVGDKLSDDANAAGMSLTKLVKQS